MPLPVALYVPNLIGYARIALALTAFAVADRMPGTCVALYGLSFVMDELDGRFARLLGQTSTLGAVLDMVTDRVATTGLASILYARAIRMVDGGGGTAHLAVGLCLLLFGLVALDIFSHWFHMYAILATKGFGTSHKDTSASQPWLLRLYYTKRIFMGFCCVCVEVLYLALYVLTFAPSNAIARGVVVASAPGFLLKNVANLVQLRDAAKTLVRLDDGEREEREERERARPRRTR
jgi:CDP-diacylglycerol--inositol 3-phosphatidyltransferase